MYTKTKKLNIFVCVVSIILKGKSVDIFAYKTKTVPEVQQETHGSQIVPVKSHYRENFGMGVCIDVLNC